MAQASSLLLGHIIDKEKEMNVGAISLTGIGSCAPTATAAVCRLHIWDLGSISNVITYIAYNSRSRNALAGIKLHMKRINAMATGKEKALRDSEQYKYIHLNL